MGRNWCQVLFHFWEILKCVPSSPFSFQWPKNRKCWSLYLQSCCLTCLSCYWETSGQGCRMPVVPGMVTNTGPFLPGHLSYGWSHFLVTNNLASQSSWSPPLACFHISSCFWKSSSIFSLIHVPVHQKKKKIIIIIIVTSECTHLLASVWGRSG